jgi:hypothetical protein
MGERRLVLLARWRTWWILPALACLLLLLSCSAGSRDQVLGEWVNVNPNSKISRLEFRDNDSLHIQLEGVQLAGVWKVVNKYRVQIRLAELPGRMPELETLIAIHDSTLVWTLPGNSAHQEFKRGS